MMKANRMVWRLIVVVVVFCSLSGAARAEVGKVQFSKEVLPILAHNCFSCHANGKKKGGLELTSREAVLKGGKNGAAIVVGKSDDSLLIKLVISADDDERMPAEKPALSKAEIALLKQWIDQGASWDANVGALPPKPNVKPRTPMVPAGDGNPIDRILAGYFKDHQIKTSGRTVDDRRYARRVFFDVIGLPPTPAEMDSFVNDNTPNKRAMLVKSLLARKDDYAENWISFWCDHLRSGSTFGIDGKNININGWLMKSLRANMPYDQFVRKLIDAGADGPRGFVDGLRMRGVVDTSARTELQAAQNIGQVFLGTQVKCATCHDSFTSQWTQAEVWGMATIFSDTPMEIARCEVPTGKIAAPSFLFPEVGTIDLKLSKARQVAQLAELVTSKSNGPFARTIVNRIWSKLMGRGLIEPLDSIENAAWHPDLLDFLASDLVNNGHDLQHTIELICTSNAYQMMAVDDAELTSLGAKDGSRFVFAGPRYRRLTAEQYADAISQIGQTKWATITAMPPAPTASKPKPENAFPLGRAWTHTRSSFQEALGRPDRNNVTTIREIDPSTLQSLQILTGPDLGGALNKMATTLTAKKLATNNLAMTIHQRAFGRAISPGELKIAENMLTATPTAATVADYLWLIVALPEFQILD